LGLDKNTLEGILYAEGFVFEGKGEGHRFQARERERKLPVYFLNFKSFYCD